MIKLLLYLDNLVHLSIVEKMKWSSCSTKQLLLKFIWILLKRKERGFFKSLRKLVHRQRSVDTSQSKESQ